MNVASFHQQSLDQRTTLIKKEGIFLASCHRLVCHSGLFYVRHIYAEVWYEGIGEKIFLIRGFTSLNGLEPYLKLIQLINIPMSLD
ncbi:hypothetical protein AHMF7605_21670 [Adhaeribacter arboris]|uniref:Uncharacterized protein n=1 Tax=Adhaeribacter arboris TaxID=2072846 RepID=A0A2T2YK84_9BACT|nr:hypothetical protein [Adhaeribacter arboris]PSR55923.1 hypothetical protein AHMF7605_21670 [Adhaeribacter arboris]